jgi:branched-chain amino acid transport system substrate-binding protein
LQVQASRAKVIAPANAGGDAINSIKQATEFDVLPGSQKFVNLPTFIKPSTAGA